MNVIKSDIDWDQYFFNIVDEVSRKSKDPSTKVGCIIASNDNRITSCGYNGFPEKVLDLEERYTNRNIKLYFAEHAERNAVYSASRKGISLDNCKIYTPSHPCHDCGRAIIQCGIKEVIFRDTKSSYYERWKVSIEFASIMFKEAGIKVRTREDLV